VRLRKRSYIPSSIKFSRKITRKFNALRFFCYSLGHGWFPDVYFYHRSGWSNNTPSLGHELHYVSVFWIRKILIAAGFIGFFPWFSRYWQASISPYLLKTSFLFCAKFVIDLHILVSRLSMHLVYVHVATYTKKYSTFIQTYSAKWSRIRY